MEKDENWIHISKHIVEIVDLKFEKVQDKFLSAEKALELREQNLRKDLEHLNNLRADYEKQKLSDSKEYVRQGEYSIQHKVLADKIDFQQKMLYLGLGALLAIEFILKYFNK